MERRFKSLAEYLDNNGETQEGFAARIGVTQATISRIASGSVLPSLTLAKRIAKATGIPLDSFELRRKDVA